jgi:hypothetical protein
MDTDQSATQQMLSSATWEHQMPELPILTPIPWMNTIGGVAADRGARYQYDTFDDTDRREKAVKGRGGNTFSHCPLA